ncbi:13099_t:CDS:2 [Cetraspora pellucida]|uniref:13099_t:CDS:1 n=1 Tax=Cetraspora pellucida TaxID=1433469 RepID=A0ACA9LNF9_9GLOM|nr:13099_t:CDS:2 [Cetraspora pellucida]
MPSSETIPKLPTRDYSTQVVTALQSSASPFEEVNTSEDEAQHLARIKKLFEEFDREKSGVLTRIAIQNGLKRLKDHPAQKKYASELLLKCDTSEDGLVDFQEFKIFVEEKEKELMKIFLDIDKSHDMRLQPEELENALKKAGINCTKVELKKFIDTMDKDGNGVIDFSEWRDFLLFLPRETTLFEIYEYYQVVTQVSIDGEVIIPPTDPKYLVAGAIAAPLDRLKVYLQTQTKELARGSEILLGSKGFSNLVNAVRALYADGLLNFFRGNGINVAKIAPECAIKFFAYEKSKTIIAHLMDKQDIGSIGMTGRFLSGGLGGVVSQFSIYPLETWKTRVMSSKYSNSNGSLLINTAKEMWRTQGFRSFYKGLIPSLLGMFPYAAIDMSVYETLKLTFIKRERSKNPGKEPEQPSAWVSLVCGTISGSIGATIVYPLSLVRTRLQAQGTPGHPQTYTGALDVIHQTYAKEKIKGFYKGLIPALTKP